MIKQQNQHSRTQPALALGARQAGLTLLELLIAVAIVAIMLTTVAPAIQSILIKSLSLIHI